VRVVVAGAGFAGLMAADRVAQAGHEVVVLEARDRVGGRVWSQELVPGDPRTVVERGGEFVLDGYDLMRAVAGELGLRFADTAMSYYEREPRGGAATTHLQMARCAEFVTAAAARARPGTSLAEVAAGWSGSPAALAAYVSRIEVTHGVTAASLAATAVADVTGGFARRPSWRVAGGNQQVAGGLAARLPAPVRLRCAVRAIENDQDGVRDLPFSPPVAGRYRSAWQRAGLAHNAKLHVPLAGPAAASAVQNVPDRFWTWTAAGQTGQVQPVLHAFSGTEAGLALDLSRAMLTTWNDDPWAGESYSASTVTAAEVLAHARS
jgi:4-methylaminobutanoate oxidase (methylamine-forming)